MSDLIERLAENNVPCNWAEILDLCARGCMKGRSCDEWPQLPVACHKALERIAELEAELEKARTPTNWWSEMDEEYAHGDPETFVEFSDGTLEAGHTYEFTPLVALPKVWYATVPGPHAEFDDGRWYGDLRLDGPHATKEMAQRAAEAAMAAKGGSDE